MQDRVYKQVVILSGKGGTGKTTLAAVLSSLLRNKVIVDCDVDAANLHIALNPVVNKSFEFSGSKKAEIDTENCSKCGLCESLCRFDAIGAFSVNPAACEGCGLCFRACPSDAVIFQDVQTGKYYESTLSDGTKLYYAKLNPGEGNSGKLVTEIKKLAVKNILDDIQWMIVDGPPGIGCPVNASIASADFAIIITEPTVTGIHDLKRIITLLNKFRIKYGIVVNKYDINGKETGAITAYAFEENIPILGLIPFNNKFKDDFISGISFNNVVSGIREPIDGIKTKMMQCLSIPFN